MDGQVLEFKDLNDTREIVEQRIPPFGIYFFYFIVSMILIFLIWSIFGVREITVVAGGIVQAEETQSITMPGTGTISKINFKEGDLVQEGDIIIEFEIEPEVEGDPSVLHVIEAEFQGVIHFISSVKIGDSPYQGQEVLKVNKKGDKLLTELYVQNTQIAQIEVGQNVRVQVGALSPKKYGYANATVIEIDSDSTLDQSSGVYYYIVKAEINDTTLTKGGNSAEIKFGMQVEARMIVDTQRYLIWFIEKIFG